MSKKRRKHHQQSKMKRPITHGFVTTNAPSSAQAISLCEEAQAQYNSADTDGAIHKLQQAIKLAPQVKNAHYLLALCYDRLGQSSQALPAVEQELKQNPDHRQAKVLLGRLTNLGSALKQADLYFDGVTVPSTWPTVSLCMIVKDEEKYLADCLKSVGDFASEMIIVDTGSTDKTVEIAESFGAKVKTFRWINDFAAARNESIKEAQGEWIFWMDADDRLSPANLIRLKQASASNQADAYVCAVASQVHGRGESSVTVDHIRLFRNSLDLQFEGPIHEGVGAAVVRQQLRLGQTNIEVNHTGYAAGRTVLQEKARRNQAILLPLLDQEPDNLIWRYHLGIALNMLNEWPEALGHFEAVVINPPELLSVEVDLYQAYTSLIAAYMGLHRYDEAQDALERAMTIYPARRHLWVIAGMLRLDRDKPTEAITALTQAQTLPQQTAGKGFAWPAGKLEQLLCQAHLLLGQLNQAKAAYIAMLSLKGLSAELVPEPLLQQAYQLLEQQQYGQIELLLAPIAQADSNALRLLAQASINNQNWNVAAHYLAGVVILNGTAGDDWVQLANLVFKAGSLNEATRYCHLALTQVEQNREKAPALNLLGLIAIERAEAEQALTYFVQAFLADPDNEPAQANLNRAAQSQALSLPEAIQQVGQRLMNQQDYANAADLFATIIKFAPQDAGSHKLLAIALQKLGRPDDAVLCWQRAEQLLLEMQL